MLAHLNKYLIGVFQQFIRILYSVLKIIYFMTNVKSLNLKKRFFGNNYNFLKVFLFS